MLGTCLDITFAVIKMSQFSANPSQDHLEKAMYIMHYLIGTQYYHVVYNGIQNEGLIAHTDSDWAGDPIKCQSTTGFFVSLASGIAGSHNCKRQLRSPPLKPNIWLYQIHVNKLCGFSPCSRNLATIWCPHQFMVTIKVRSLSDQTQSKNGGQNTLTFAIITYASALKMAKYLSTLSLAMRIWPTCLQRTLVPYISYTSGSILG